MIIPYFHITTSVYVLFSSLQGNFHTVDGYRNLVHHLGCIQQKVVKNGIFTTCTYQLVTAGFLPSTVHSLKLT